jgi:hypothetical protein
MPEVEVAHQRHHPSRDRIVGMGEQQQVNRRRVL